jgi:N-acetylmuramoyl-L-alanine amidase
VHQALRSAVVPAGLTLAVVAGTVPALAAPAPAELAPPPAAAAADGVPETLASSVPASGRVVNPSFPVDYVAVTWTGEHGQALVRFRHGTAWTAWQDMAEDGVEEPGEFASGVVPAGDADAYQVRIPAGVRGARSVAINTTDGDPVSAGVRTAATATGEKTTWGVVTRAGWGANEMLRFHDGVEDWPQAFHPPQKLTVHHTAGINDDPDPAATVRAIYRFHAIDRGWGDIGYQFLIDARGTVYEGRQSDSSTATPPAFDAEGNVVQGAHVASHNSGNIGVSLLGTYSTRRPSVLAQRSLERLLASLSVKTGISPTAWSRYDNGDPDLQYVGPNILGHRHWPTASTSCPGGITFALLPTIRERVAQRIAGTIVADSTMAPPRSITVSTSSSAARVTWWTRNDPSDTQLRYWPAGKPSRAKSTPLDIRFVQKHSVLVTGLARGRYEYQMINADKAGNRRVSGVLTFRVG